LVHIDVWGPAQELSYGGKRYFVTFIDDATRKTWVYALREKSEIFGMFRMWKTMVEKETGYQIKVLKSDNGGEYTSKEFADYLSREGKHGLKIVQYHPPFSFETLRNWLDVFLYVKCSIMSHAFFFSFYMDCRMSVG